MSATHAHPEPWLRTAVLGLGRTGVSAIEHLVSHALAVSAFDTRREPPGLAAVRHRFPDVAVHTGGPLQAGMLGRAVELVVSPGLDLREPAIAAALRAAVPVCGDIELFARVVRGPVIGITGSNGKSTVTAMLDRMTAAAGMTARTGGNFGTPALELLPRPSWAGRDARPRADVYLLELSSFQLETTHSLELRAAAWLNFSADHMDRYARLDDYFAAKRRIVDFAPRLVMSRDHPALLALGRESEAAGKRVIGITAGAPGPGDYGVVVLGGERWLARRPAGGGRRRTERLMPAAAVGLAGEHNVANALAALALAELLGLELPACLSVVRRFAGLPHRCEMVGSIGGVRWINDSKGTNVGAAVAAVTGLSSAASGEAGPRLVLIAGGDAKGADFSPLRDVLVGRVRTVILFGRDAGRIATEIAGPVPVRRADALGEAVRLARQAAHAGDTVLLSPACASWDMFSSYEARGEAFVREVAGMEGGR